MTEPIFVLNSILEFFTCNDNDIRADAENKYFELLQNDPNLVMNLHLMNITQNPNQILRWQSLIGLKNFIFRAINAYKNIQQVDGQTKTILSQETIANITNHIIMLLQSDHLKSNEMEYVYLIINSFMTFLIRPGLWPEIINVMRGMIETPQCHLAIKFFANYVSTVQNLNEISPDLLQQIPQFIRLDSSDPKVRVASIHLSFNLMLYNTEMLNLLGIIPNVMISLPDSELCESITLVESFFQRNYQALGPFIDGIVTALLEIAKDVERQPSGRITSLELLYTMITRSPPVRRFFLNRIDFFIQVLTICFVENNFDEPIYNKACELFEEFIGDDLKLQKQMLEIVEQNIQTLPPPAISAFFRYMPSANYINRVMELAQVADSVISFNAFETISEILHKSYTKLVKQNTNTIPTLSSLLFSLVNAGCIQAIDPLARLAEQLVEYNKKLLAGIAQELLQIPGKFLNANSIRCAAAVARAFPNEVSPNALNFANTAMGLIINERTNDDDRYALMISVSTFAKCMNVDHLQSFVNNLMSLVNQFPASSMYLGLRIIAQQIGEQFAPFLQSIVPYLVNTASQEIDLFVETCDTNNEGFSVTYIPNTNNKMLFRNEQLYEMCSALDSLGDYALAVGYQYAQYYDATFKAATYAINIVFDTQIRLSAAKLLSSLARSIPEHIGDIFAVILRLFAVNKTAESEDIFAEFDVEVQKELMSSLETIVQLSQCPKEVQFAFLQSLPELLSNAINSIRRDVENDEFEGVEDDHYLNLLWSMASAIKALYEGLPNEAGATFIQISSLLKPFQNEPILLINQFSLAAWTDFLIFGPMHLVSQCDNMIKDVMEMSNSQDPDLRRISLYSIGRIIERKQMTSSDIDNILSFLFSIATSESAQEDESLFAGNDCALSSYALLLKKRIPMGDAPIVILQFIEMFPAEDDLDEAKISYEYLFELFWNFGNHPEMSQTIAGKLFEGLQIETLNPILKNIIQDKTTTQPNIPQHVAGFLAAISQ